MFNRPTVRLKDIAKFNRPTVRLKDIAKFNRPTVRLKDIAMFNRPTVRLKDIAMFNRPTVRLKDIAMFNRPTVRLKDIAMFNRPTVRLKDISMFGTPGRRGQLVVLPKRLRTSSSDDASFCSTQVVSTVGAEELQSPLVDMPTVIRKSQALTATRKCSAVPTCFIHLPCSLSRKGSSMWWHSPGRQHATAGGKLLQEGGYTEHMSRREANTKLLSKKTEDKTIWEIWT
jgi:hypothetical protein